MFPNLRYLFLHLLLIFNSPIFAQINSESISSANDNNTPTPKSKSELIYLQTSKGIYETGEDLWFKAYILDAQHFIPSGLSKTLYLQLMNEETRQVFWQEKYEIIKRFADGHVFLNDTLPEGNYLLMAFTANSFFNDSSEFESFCRIIIKKDMKPRVSVKAEFSQPFFSEGETIGVNILVLSEQAKAMYAVITAELVKEGKIIETLKDATNTEGKCVLFFQTAKASPGLLVKVNVKHTNAVEEINLPVPFHKGSPIQFSTFPEGGYLVSG
jgi:hypothetical protein